MLKLTYLLQLSSKVPKEEKETVHSFPFPLADSLMLSSPLLKSRQLLHDDLGEVNPRLREPRDLFAFFSTSGPLQAPRWPIECEVIKENIHHIGNVTYVSWSCRSDRLYYSFKFYIPKYKTGQIHHLLAHP